MIVQFGAGLSYRISDMFNVDLSYRYFETEDLDIEVSNGEVTTKYKGSAITAGLRWYWNRGE